MSPFCDRPISVPVVAVVRSVDRLTRVYFCVRPRDCVSRSRDVMPRCIDAIFPHIVFLMPPRTKKQQGDAAEDHDDWDVGFVVPDSEENVFDDEEDENDENTPLNDDNSAPLPALSFAPRSSSLRTPVSHAPLSEDIVLRDITDQFFYPPSPSPVRISKNTLKRPSQSTLEPPHRPKKPKAQAFPADPPNWVHTIQPSSSLPPSSPLPTSATAYDNGRMADRAHGHISSIHYYEYELMSAPTKQAPDSDPFGFLAVERALKAKRVAAPPPPVRRPAPRVSTVTIKSPPRSTVVLSNTPSAPVRSSSVRPDAPIPTNYENIDDLYLDEPVAGPSSHPLVPSAPLLVQQSVQNAMPEPHTTHSQTTFPDPLRTPRKRKRVNSVTPEVSLEESAPSSPSPVKVSLGRASAAQTNCRLHAQSKVQDRVPTTPVQKHTRARSAKARGKQPVGKDSSNAPAASKRLRTVTRSHIPTPSSTPPVHRRSVVEASSPSAMSTPSPPKRRSARQAAAAKHPARDLSSESESEVVGRIRTRLRSARSPVEPRTEPSPARRPNTRSGSQRKGVAASKSAKPVPRATRGAAKGGSVTRGRGRGRGKAAGTAATRGANAKGKRTARPLEDVLGMSDDTREVSRFYRVDVDRYLTSNSDMKGNDGTGWTISNVLKVIRYRRRTYMLYERFLTHPWSDSRVKIYVCIVAGPVYI